MIAKVISTFTVPGFHAWRNAPAVVEYLSSPHRHLFKFKIECIVGHHNRHVEFHMLQRESRQALGKLFSRNEFGEFLFGERSCEMIAAELIAHVNAAWKSKVHAVEVWEDDECGGRVEAGQETQELNQ